VVCLGRFLGSIKGIFRPVTPVGSSINVLISRGVLVSPASVVASLVTANNIYKRMFI
jgi:hypothetical protein